MLYIHIPFCDSKCGYCAFFSAINKTHLIESYFTSLLLDLKSQLNFAHNLGKFKKINSVFIGGGTPNMVDSKFYKNVFETFLPFCEVNCEISIESNPNLLTKKWLNEMTQMGVNRLSMGIQSFFSDKLNMLERNHNKKDIQNALNIARNEIDNFSIDLIYDCKLDSKKRMQSELESSIKLEPNHISAYSLSIESNSNFGENKRYDLQYKKESLGYFVRDFLQSSGYKQYEVSNYSKNKKCKHNLGYWQGKEYLGIGAGAVGRLDISNLDSKTKAIRYSTPKNIESYIKNPLFKHKENLTKQNLDFEKIFLGFRSEIGVDISLCDIKKAKILLDEKMCEKNGEKIYAKDYFLADSIALYIS